MVINNNSKILFKFTCPLSIKQGFNFCSNIMGFQCDLVSVVQQLSHSCFTNVDAATSLEADEVEL